MIIITVNKKTINGNYSGNDKIITITAIISIMVIVEMISIKR